MDDKDPDMLRPAIVAVLLACLFAIASCMDYADALTDEAIRKDPPRIIAYSIKQDSPGLDNGERLIPFHPPVAQAKPAPKKHRRSMREHR